jgi:hypothetical protein
MISGFGRAAIATFILTRWMSYKDNRCNNYHRCVLVRPMDSRGVILYFEQRRSGTDIQLSVPGLMGFQTTQVAQNP